MNWEEKAHQNIKKWGLQSEDVLILAMTEELGEIAHAYLQSEYEGQPRFHIMEELDDLMALGHQLKWRLEKE